MRPNTVDSSKAPGTNRFFGALALVVVGAVLVGGVATFAGSALQAAESGPAGVSGTPFTFDAPTATLQRFKPNEAGAGGPATTAQADALVLGDWKFTQVSITPAEALFLDIEFFYHPQILPGLFLLLLNPGVSDFLASLPPIGQFFALDFIAFLLLDLNPATRGQNPLLPPPTPAPPATAST